jgi:hypothetical protein
MIAELLLAATMLQSTPAPKNPTTVTFNCADHDRDDQHELDIIRVSDGAVIQTVLLGDPAADANGVVTATVNVQPIAFGQYKVRVRAVAGTVKSADSADSNVFDRVPGSPTKVNIQ